MSGGRRGQTGARLEEAAPRRTDSRRCQRRESFGPTAAVRSFDTATDTWYEGGGSRGTKSWRLTLTAAVRLPSSDGQGFRLPRAASWEVGCRECVLCKRHCRCQEKQLAASRFHGRWISEATSAAGAWPYHIICQRDFLQHMQYMHHRRHDRSYCCAQ